MFKWAFSICLCIAVNTVSLGQSSSLISLPDAIKQLASQSSFTVNYDPDQLTTYQVSLPVKGDFFHQLDALLKNTPFTYEQAGQVILIYLPDQESYNICGYLVDSYGLPLSYASIFLEGTNQGTSSDENGYFQFDCTAFKNASIQISYLGYVPIQRSVRFFQKNSCPQFLMEINTELSVSEVVVTDYLLKGSIEGESYSSIAIDFTQAADQLPPLEQDILRSVQLLPGITSSNESASSLRIRGSSPDQNLILWEGVPLYSPGHFFDMISTINPFVVDKVDVYKGVVDPSFDNRIGGIIDISVPAETPKRWETSLGTTLTELHFHINAPIIKEKLSILWAGRQSLENLLETPTAQSYSSKVFQSTKVSDLNEIAQEELADFEQVNNYSDWNTKVIFKPFDFLKLSMGYLESSNDFNYSFSYIEDDWSSIDQLDYSGSALNLDAEVILSPKWQASLAFRESGYENVYSFMVTDEDSEDSFYSLFQSNDIKDSSIKLATNIQPDSSIKLSLGVDLNQKRVDFLLNEQDNQVDSFQIEESLNGTFANIFGGVSLSGKRHLINLGFRATRYYELSQWDISPRVDFRYALTEKFKVKGAIGTVHQYISQLKNFESNELGISNPIWILSEPETGNTLSSNKGSLGFIYKDKNWLVDLETYLTNTKGLSTRTPILNPVVNQNLDEFFVGNSKTAGFDLLSQYRYKNLNTSINYSFSDVKYLFPNLQDDYFNANDNHRHSIKLLQDIQWRKWRLYLTYQWKTGLFYSSPSGINEFREEDEDEPSFLLEYNDLNTSQLPTYSRLDLGIRYFPSFGKRLKGEIALAALNITNRQNIFSRDYFLDDFEEDNLEAVEQFYIEKRLLGITPTFLIRLFID